jgi:excisionase family DNA binding protein
VEAVSKCFWFRGPYLGEKIDYSLLEVGDGVHPARASEQRLRWHLKGLGEQGEVINRDDATPRLGAADSDSSSLEALGVVGRHSQHLEESAGEISLGHAGSAILPDLPQPASDDRARRVPLLAAHCLLLYGFCAWTVAHRTMWYSSGMNRNRTPKKDRPLLAVGPEAAAEMLDVSRDHLEKHILGELRYVRRGRRILIPVSELTRWLERNAGRAVG